MGQRDEAEPLYLVINYFIYTTMTVFIDFHASNLFPQQQLIHSYPVTS